MFLRIHAASDELTSSKRSRNFSRRCSTLPLRRWPRVCRPMTMFGVRMDSGVFAAFQPSFSTFHPDHSSRSPRGRRFNKNKKVHILFNELFDEDSTSLQLKLPRGGLSSSPLTGISSSKRSPFHLIHRVILERSFSGVFSRRR